LTVRGTTELVPWILSLGPYAEVLKPRALREEVQESLAEAMHVYVAHPELARRVPLAAGQARTRDHSAPAARSVSRNHEICHRKRTAVLP